MNYSGTLLTKKGHLATVKYGPYDIDYANNTKSLLGALFISDIVVSSRPQRKLTVSFRMLFSIWSSLGFENVYVKMLRTTKHVLWELELTPTNTAASTYEDELFVNYGIYKPTVLNAQHYVIIGGQLSGGEVVEHRRAVWTDAQLFE